MTNKATKYGLMTIAAVLLVAMAFAGAASAADGNWIDEADTSWYNNQNTVFTLTTPQQFAGFAKLVNTKVDNFTGKIVKLGADIDLSGKEWTPIGNKANPFKGEFDGLNKSIKNLTITVLQDDVGLFGVITSATISNVKLVDSSISLTLGLSNAHVGSLVGKVDTNNIIENCHAQNVSIITEDPPSAAEINTGGLLGCMWKSAMDNCSTSGSIISECTESRLSYGKQSRVGGIIGCLWSESPNDHLVRNVSSSAKVVSRGCTGGIAGYVYSGIFIQNSYSTGDLTGDRCGGIFTHLEGYYYDIKNCWSSGNITAKEYAGGIMSSEQVGGSAEINNVSDCYVLGQITSSGGAAGGIIGMSNSRGNIKNCSVMSPLIVGTEAGRICGSGVAKTNYTGNYAWEGMLVNGALVSSGTSSNKDGINVSSFDIWNNQSFFQNTLGWDFENVWKMNNGNDNYKLPVLKWQRTPVSGDASYLIPITVTFDTQGGSAVDAQNISKGLNATRPADDPTKAGYVFENWYNESACTGVFDFAAKLTADTVAYANWTVNTTTVTASDNEAEFGNENITAIRSASGNVVKVLLENVMLVENEDVVFIADNSTLNVPDLNGYTKDDDIAVFEINASVHGDHSEIVINVTFADAANATANKDKIKFSHFNTQNNAWDKNPLKILNEPEQDGANVTYQIQTTSFSPFGIGIYTAIPQQYTPSSSSKQTSSTIILSEGQVAPTAYATATPTAAPTVKPTEEPATPTVIATAKPTTQATQQSPAPFVGLIAGLGAAAVLLRLRK